MLKDKWFRFFLGLILLPNLIFFGSTPLEKYSDIFRYTEHKGIFLLILSLPIIGSISMLIYSIKYKNYLAITISSIFLIITVSLFWVVYSLSNFAFF